MNTSRFRECYSTLYVDGDERQWVEDAGHRFSEVADFLYASLADGPDATLALRRLREAFDQAVNALRFDGLEASYYGEGDEGEDEDVPDESDEDTNDSNECLHGDYEPDRPSCAQSETSVTTTETNEEPGTWCYTCGDDVCKEPHSLMQALRAGDEPVYPPDDSPYSENDEKQVYELSLLLIPYVDKYAVDDSSPENPRPDGSYGTPRQ